MISSEVGLRKPDPAVYALAAERLGLPPDACVFVDDLGGNLKPARALGMATVLHRGDARCHACRGPGASEIVGRSWRPTTSCRSPASPGRARTTSTRTGSRSRRGRGASRTPLPRPRGSGAGSGKVHFEDFAFTTRLSKASPALFLACASGQHIKEAKLAARKGAAKGQQEYLTWTFSDVLVTSYETQGADGDDSVQDAISLNFSKAVVSYKAQKADGSLAAPITVGWDAKKNAKI